MSVPIDDIDRALLSALLADGRASASDLAETADVATATVTKRLSRLEEDGVIEGFQPQIDYDAAGYGTTAVFRLDVDGEGLSEVVADLQATGRMVGVYEVTGEHDVVAIGKFTGTEELNEQIKTLLTHPHVRATSTNIVLETVSEYDAPPVAPAE